MLLKFLRRRTKLPALLPLSLLTLLTGSLLVIAQTPNRPESQGDVSKGGVSTGAPVNYSSRRTVGVTDPKAPVVFEDVTDKTALANFKHRSVTTQKNYIFDTTPGGVAIFDYDGDGLADVYLLN